MDISLRFHLLTNKANSKGLSPIAIVITQHGRRVFHSTGIRIPESSWVDNQIKNFPHADIHNAKLNKIKSELERDLLNRDLNGEKLTIKKAKALLESDTGKRDFLRYAETYLAYVAKSREPGTHRRKVTEYKRLEGKYPRLLFADITAPFLAGYYEWMTTEGGLDNNSAIVGLKFIREVFNYAKLHGVTSLYPFADYKVPAYVEPDKGYLTYDECVRINDLLKDDISQEIKTVAAFFLIECFAGIRVSDWSRFSVEKLIEGDALKVKAKKNSSPVYLPLKNYPILRSVIDYIAANGLKFTETGQHANRILKVIAPLARINKRMTTHYGRHTCATLHLEKGYSKEYIADLLGVSMKVVNTYAKTTRQKHRNESERLGGF